jgi:hypothetical protein
MNREYGLTSPALNWRVDWGKAPVAVMAKY